jgi:AMIN domain
MTSWSRCGIWLAIGISLAAPIAAQDLGRVHRVSVLKSGQGIEVEIQTSGTVTPQSQRITGPDRIVVDFPGALPGPGLHTFTVNRGALKAIRAGLFSANPPVTRVVLDLLAPQAYQIFSIRNVVILKLGPAVAAGSKTQDGPPAAALNEALLEAPPKPAMEVTFHDGLLRIHVERATLAQVLYEVQRQTGAEIAIPAGAESEEMAAELGPAPAREVLAALLNGSRYNFIFVGNNRGRNLEKAILSVR